MPKKAYLVLENGVVFEGYGFGAEGDVTGETVFTTGATGYLEVLTDKTNFGQIVAHTFPQIGNYGIIPDDFEGDSPAVKGYIVKQWCQDPSNFRSESDLDTFLKSHGIVGLYGIDIRRLTKILRDEGTMTGRITDRITDKAADELKNFKPVSYIPQVSTQRIYTLNEGGKFNIGVLDFGLRKTVLEGLFKRDCSATVYPWDTSAEDILKNNHQGVFLSNGPGDPSSEENQQIVAAVKKLAEANIPIFAIGFGGGILALAHGLKTKKLNHGHRGSNQPVRDLNGLRTYITKQNHSYVIDPASLEGTVAKPWFINVNDNSLEGLKYENRPFYSIEFYPETSGGPQDTLWVFDGFVADLDR